LRLDSITFPAPFCTSRFLPDAKPACGKWFSTATVADLPKEAIQNRRFYNWWKMKTSCIDTEQLDEGT